MCAQHTLDLMLYTQWKLVWGNLYGFILVTYKNAFGLGKDVIYSVKNSAKNNWRLLLLSQSFICINNMEVANKNATIPPLASNNPFCHY